MFCTKCGYQIDADFRYCDNCGAQVDDMPVAQEAVPVPKVRRETDASAPESSAPDVSVFCTKCGAKMDADSLFCEQCGAAADDTPVAQNSLLDPLPKPSVLPQQYSPQKKETSGAGRFFRRLFGVLDMLAAPLFIYLGIAISSTGKAEWYVIPLSIAVGLFLFWNGSKAFRGKAFTVRGVDIMAILLVIAGIIGLITSL